MEQSVVSIWRISNKNYGYQGSSELPWLAILHEYCHTVSRINNVHERRLLEALHLENSFTLYHVSLPLADFNVNSFTVLNNYHGYNSFQWVLWVKANYWTLGSSWKPKLAIGVRNKNGLGDCSLTLQPHSVKADDQLGQWLSKGILDLGLKDF